MYPGARGRYASDARKRKIKMEGGLDVGVFLVMLTRGKNFSAPTWELGSDNLAAAAVELKQLNSNSGRLSEC